MAEEPSPFAGLTLQDQKLIMGAFKCLKNGFEVDYSKLAEHMDWFVTKEDGSKPNVRKANNAWLVTRKKLFPDGFPAAASNSGAPKAKTPSTPRKKKDADTPQTSLAKKTPAKKDLVKAEDGDEDEDIPHENGDKPAFEPVKNLKRADKETGEGEVKENSKVATSEKQGSDTDGDTPMKHSNTANDPITPRITASVTDDMSAGSMSPSPLMPKTKPSAITPNAKAESKANKTPKTDTAATAAKVPLPETPTTPLPKATAQKRKSKVEKEAEAGTTSGEDGDDGDVDNTPPAKKRKSVDGKAKLKSQSSNETDDADSNGGELVKSTPAKTPRKPSANQLAKREEKAKERAAKKAEKEQEKADKKAEKEREKAEKKAEKEKEKAEKQAAKKGGKGAAATDVDGDGETSKSKTPRKPTAAQQAKKGEAEQAKKAADAKRVAQAAQEVMDKQAEEVFKGTRTDKPAKPEVEDDSDEEATVTNGHDAPKANEFVAINGEGKANAVTSAAVAKAIKTADVATEEDGDTIAVEDEETIVVESSG